MNTQRTRERGEGKIGCILTLAVLIAAGCVAFKVVPVLWANNGLVTAAEDLGSRAGLMPAPALEQQLRAKAAELEIPEALAKGAINFKILGDSHAGTCIVELHYVSKVDLFGVYTLKVPVDKSLVRPYMDAR
jgi:hypothetical protein